MTNTHSKTETKQQHNARLIAAAPDMFAELCAIRTALELTNTRGLDAVRHLLLNERLPAIRAVIAKAIGARP